MISALLTRRHKPEDVLVIVLVCRMGSLLIGKDVGGALVNVGGCS